MGKSKPKPSNKKNVSGSISAVSTALGKMKISKTKKKKGPSAPPQQRPPRNSKSDANKKIKDQADEENSGKKYDRKSEYPSNYRPDTHNNMALNHTDEGKSGKIKIENGQLVDSNGKPVSPDSLTWRDSNGKKIDYYGYSQNGTKITNLTYEHKNAVVDHWNSTGYNSNRNTRNDFYNDWKHMEAMGRSDNSSGGGSMTSKYRQDVGANYSFN